MEFYINFFIQNLILDIAIILILHKLFKLSLNKLEFFVLVIFSVMPQILYASFSYMYVWFVVSKLIFYLFLSVFSANNLNFREVFCLYGGGVLMMFSVFGFAEFFLKFIEAVFLELFGISISVLFHFLVTLALVLYVFLLYFFLVTLPRQRKSKEFFKNVSFFLFGRHIEITGLIDTGNTLYDTKTKKPVIVVSISALKKFLSENEIEMLETKNYVGLDISSELPYRSASGKDTMPIIDIGQAKITKGKDEFYYKSVLGIASFDLTTEKYDCLLGKEFL